MAKLGKGVSAKTGRLKSVPLGKHGDFRRVSTNTKQRIRRELMLRDGPNCWLCEKALGADMSIDHFEPLALGGRNRISNLKLMHAACNNLCGDMSRLEKQRLKERLKGE